MKKINAAKRLSAFHDGKFENLQDLFEHYMTPERDFNPLRNYVDLLESFKSIVTAIIDDRIWEIPDKYINVNSIRGYYKKLDDLQYAVRDMNRVLGTIEKTASNNPDVKDYVKPLNTDASYKAIVKDCEDMVYTICAICNQDENLVKKAIANTNGELAR